MKAETRVLHLADLLALRIPSPWMLKVAAAPDQEHKLQELQTR
jgi:hypothetical protein